MLAEWRRYNPDELAINNKITPADTSFNSAEFNRTRHQVHLVFKSYVAPDHAKRAPKLSDFLCKCADQATSDHNRELDIDGQLARGSYLRDGL